MFDHPYCDAVNALVNWTEPALKNRNGLISKYIITWSIVSGVNYTVGMPDPYERDSKMFSTEIIGLHPFSLYTLKVCRQNQ